MLRIPCPFCGERDEDEFIYGGDADRQRPADPQLVSETQWTDYLYHRNNTKGPVIEWWWHVQGCTKWFQIERDTLTHTINEVRQSLT